MNFLIQAAATLLAPFLLIGGSIGSALAPAQEPTLGASEEIPTTIAFFETTLASSISSSATSFTLTSAVDKDGTTLASSTYAFVIDEGSANEEIVLADCTGTACTNAERGISVRTGNTEVTALKKSHRRGASVKITDAPLLPLVARILRGEGTVDYTPSTGGNLVTKTYVDSLALGSTTVAATLTDDGIGELATGVQAASSTATDDSGSPLFLHTGISTSTAPASGHVIPVTGSDGKLDSGFLPSIYVTEASTTVFTASSTWTKPADLLFVTVEVVGGGGRGGSTNNSNQAGGGGGSGGYCKKTILAEDLGSTETVTIGWVNGASYFGTHASSTGGSDGAGTAAATAGGAGGTANATLCDLAIAGQVGGSGISHSATNYATLSGFGGSSRFGSGAVGIALSGNTASIGTDATGYGGGGSGAANANDSNAKLGGAGKSGIVIVTEYKY